MYINECTSSILKKNAEIIIWAVQADDSDVQLTTFCHSDTYM